MTRLSWDTPGERLYEAGVDRGVLYPSGKPSVPWNGLLAVRERPGNQASNVRYFNGFKYHNRAVSDSFQGTIEALTYPDDFNGELFGLCYRTLAGNDLSSDGYKLHLVYNATAEPSEERSYSSIGEKVEPVKFEWDFTTSPVVFPGTRPFAHLVVDATRAHSWVVEELETVLYGGPFTNPRLPLPAEVLEIFESGALLRVTDNGDGTWTATGPDEAIQMLDADTFEITWPSAVFIDEDTYTISSL